jgi:hypothetical protein
VDPVASVLAPDETVLWRGKLGFGLFESYYTFVFLLAVSMIVLQATWFSYSFAEFCAASPSSKCGGIYFLGPTLCVVSAATSLFGLIERRKIDSGKSLGLCLVTNRRAMRVVDWPWLRVRAFDYHKDHPRQGLKGLIHFGRRGSLRFAPEDATVVHAIMQDLTA